MGIILVNGVSKTVSANAGEVYYEGATAYIVMPDNAGFASSGAAQSIAPASAPVTTANVVSNSAPGFDPDFYKAQNPDVAASGVDPLTHFRTLGWKEGRDPNPYFDTKGYLATYGDVKASGVNPLDHYNNNGWKEGRDPSAWFDTSKYLDANPDVKAAGANPLQHFLANGQFEGRQAIPQDFVDTNPAADTLPAVVTNGMSAGITASWGGWQTTTYSILSDSSNGGFAVNPTTGAVTVADASKINPSIIYFVTVRGQDDGHVLDKAFQIVTQTPAAFAPIITSDGGAATASKSVAENTTVVTTVTSSDPDGPTPSYSIVGGADQSKFSINASSGQLSFLTAPNFEAPTDSDTNNTYIVIVRASDGVLTDDQTITVTVTDVNAAPVIAPGATGTIAENTVATTVVYDTNATDDGENTNTLTYSFGGGADDGMFSINSSTGEVRFLASPNFEAPADAGDNNVYNIIVRASDGTLTTDRAVAITVTNVNETPVAADASFLATEDVAYNGAVPAATDGDGNALTYAAIGGSAVGGAVILNSNGTFTFTPTANFNGNATFQYVANDGTVNSAAKTVTINFAPVNDAPVASADGPYAVAEDGSLSVPAATGVLMGDVDVDSAGLIATLLSGPGHATSFSLATNGAFTYTPVAGFSGQDTFVYRAFDGTAFSDPVVVTINVTAANDVPVAASSTLSASEDAASVQITLSATDSDVGDAVTSFTLGTLPASGTFYSDAALTVPVGTGSVVTATGGSATIYFKPNGDFNGPVTFNYTASDGDGSSAPATVTINVAAVNDTPVALDGILSANEDGGSVMIDVASLISDVETADAGLTVTASVSPSEGTVSVLGTVITFTPAANFNGAASISYTVSDGSLSDTATIAVTVAPANDVPVAASSTLSASEDAASVQITLSATDSDVGDAVTSFTLGTLPTSGTFYSDAALTVPVGTASVVTATGGSATIYFKPNANFNGPVVFNYTASDGDGSSAPATVTINVAAVNDAPVATDGVLSANEDGSPVMIDVASLISDVETVDAGLTVTASVPALQGTVSVLGTVITFTPAANFNGAATISYTVSDGTSSDAATIAVTVAADDDAPVAVTQTVTGVEDQVLEGHVTATDIDGGPATFSGSGTTANGGSYTVNADGSYTYTPALNFNGTDSFTFQVSNGSDPATTGTVNVTIGAVNDAPAGVADAFTINEDATPTPIFNVLGNDSDVEDAGNIPVAVSRINGTAIAIGGTVGVIGGAVTLNTDQTLSFTPTPDFAGDLSFTYTAKDGAGAESAPTLVTVHVNAVNDAPVAVNNGSVAVPIAVTEDVPLTLNLLANDFDTESGKPTIVAEIDGQSMFVGANATVAGGTVRLNADQTITFTPTANFTGTGLSFTYVARDVPGGALSNVATVTYSVTAVNDAPAIGAPDTSGTPVELLANGSFESGAAPDTFLSPGSPAISGWSVINGAVYYNQNLWQDGEGTRSVNIASGLTPGGIQTTLTTVIGQTYTVEFEMAGNWFYESNHTARVAAGADSQDFTFNSAGRSNTDMGWAPYTFTFTATSTTTTLQFTTIAGSPVIDGVSVEDPTANQPLSVTEDTPFAFAGPAAITISDVDAASGNLTVSLHVGNGMLTAVAAGSAGVVGGGTGTLTITGTLTDINSTLGSLAYTPGGNFNGADALIINVDDGGNTGAGGALSATRTVSLNVTAVNDAPAAVADTAYVTAEDTPLVLAVLGNDTDVDGPFPLAVARINSATVSVGQTVAVTGGNVTVNADGTLTFTPTANSTTDGAFTYTVKDGAGLEGNTVNVAVDVTPVNDAPVANADIGTAPTSLAGFSTNEDTPVILNVLANDTDIESGTPSQIGRINGTAVSIGSVVNVSGGQVTVNNDWTLTFTPTLNSTQDGSFTYTAKDSSGAESGQATVVVDVIALNDTPVVDLNGANAGVDRDDLPTYTSGGAAINVATALATVTDTENAISKITLTLSAVVGTPDGSPAEGLTLPAGVAATLGLIGFTVTGEGTNTIEIISNTAGGISPAVFQNILKTVLYHDNDTTFGFNAEDRTITVTATDGSGLSSGPALVQIDLAADVTDLSGVSGANNFLGANLADTIRGNDGDDTMEGRGGNDQIYGGTETGDSGLDTAKFTGDRADYTVTRTGPGVYTVADSVSSRDGTDTVHDVETLHFNGNNFDLALDAPIQVFDSTGNVLLASFQANQLSQAVNFANGHAGADIIELRSSASPFTSGAWPATITEAVTIKAVGGTATINAGANSGIAIAASAVLGATATVRLEGLDITGSGATDTVGVVFSGVYEGPSDGAIQILNTSVSGFGQNGIAIIGGGPGLSVTIDGDNAALGGVQTSAITGSGGSTTSGGGSGDVLFFAFTGAAALKNIVVTGTTGTFAGSADNGIQFAGFDGGDHSVDHAIGAVTFQNVAVNGTYEKTLVYVQGYDNLSALGFAGGLTLGDGLSAATWTALFIDGGPQGGGYIPSGAVGGPIDGTINLTGVAVSGGIYGTSPGFAVLGGKSIVVNGTLTDDQITGTAANEAFIGLTGNDQITTGGGDDVVVYNVGDGQDTVTDAGGIDALALTNFGAGGAPSASAATWNITASGATLSVDTDAAITTDEVAATGIEALVVQLGNGGDTVVLDGALAGTGLASIAVNAGAGGAGADTLDARTLSSASAINANLGASNDTYRAANVMANDNVDGAGGTGDSLDYALATAAVTIDLQANTASGTSIGTDVVSNFENATGGIGNDSISGTTGANTLSGGAGDDTLTGRGGNDTITGGSDTGTVAAHDVAVFGDVIANYTFDFTTTPGSVIVHNTVTLDDATVTGVEELQFSGGVSVALVNVAGSSLDTIVEGVTVSTAGGRVYVGNGTYNENVSIAKGIGVVGVGNSVNVHGNFKTDNPFVDGLYGGSVAEMLEVRTQGDGGYSGASGSAFTITASNVALTNINIDSFRDGVLIAADVSNIALTDIDITDTILGVTNDWGYSGIERSLSGLTITGGSISDGHNGINFEKGGAPAGIKHITGVTISGTQFSELTAKGIYFEDLSNATITGVGMNHVGYWGGEPTFGGNASGTLGFGGAGIELNLKKGAFSNIAITNFNLINTGTSDHDGAAAGQNVQDNGAAISVKIRSANPNYSPVSYTGTLDISNGTINGTSTGIRAGENNQIVDGPAVNIANVSILGAAHDARNGDIENLTTSLMSVTGKATGETWWISQQSVGQIKIDDIGGADTATYNGTTAAETFNVNLVSISGTDYVAINKEAGSSTPVLATAANSELATHNVEEIVINTGGGADTVIVSGNLGTTGLAVSTITIVGGTDADATSDTVDASGLTSTHGINFTGGGGSDEFSSSKVGGDDTFDGGAGVDTARYDSMTNGVTVDLVSHTATGVDAGDDTLLNVENVYGSDAGADSLAGDSAANTLAGFGGADSLTGRGGNDSLFGGDNTDTAFYADGPAGYTVTFNGGGTVTVTDINTGNGDEGSDTLTDVELINLNGTVIDLTANVLVYTGDYSGTGPGALKASYGSIVAALAGGSTNPGDTIIVKAGSYSENITISEGVILRGLGTVTLSGSVVIDGGGAGQNALIDNIDVNGTGNYAVQVAETSTYTTVAFKNGNVTGGNYGGLLLGDGDETGGPTGVGSLVIDTANFSGNVTTGSGGGGDGAILIYRYNGNVTLKNVDVTGSGTFIENGIQIRGAATLAASGTLSFENVDVHGTFARTGVAIRDYLSAVLAFNGSVGNSALDVDVTGGTAYTGLHIDNVGGTVNLSGANAVESTHYVPTTGAIIMTGTGGSENFTADTSNDVLVGAGGNDTLDGVGGSDIYVEVAGDGADTINDTGAPADSDTVAVFGVGTTVSAVPANDGTVSDTVSAIVVGGKLATLDGGNLTGIEVTGINLGGNGGAGDTLDYTGTTESLTVNLGTNSASGFNAGAFNIENVTGGSVGDSLTGNASANTLTGAGGDDTLKGNGGSDTLHGGAGTADTAVYDDASGNYTITYNVGTGNATVTETVVTGTNEGTDTLDGVELLDFASGDIDLNAQVLVFSSFDANTGTGTLKSSHGSIQSAVNAADGNDTVYIRNGSYTEQVNVGAGKDGLTILGQSEAGVVIHAPTTGLTFFATDPNASPVNRQLFSVVTVSGSDLVTIKNLTVDGDSQAGQIGGGSGDFNGIAYANSSGTVEDVTVREIRDTLTGPTQVSGNQRGNAVLATYTSGSPKQFNLIDSTITDYQKTGVVMRNATVNLDDNTITGFGIQNTQGQNGIQLSSGSTGFVTNNHISALGLVSGAAPAGILLFNAGIATVTGNDYTGTAVNDVAISLSGTSGSTISGNIINTAARGVVEVGTMTVENNVVNTGGTANTYAGIATWNHEINSTSNIAFTPDGSNGPDRYVTGGGNDVLTGNGGDDFLQARGGLDQMLGGAGNDTIVWTAGDGNDTLIDGGAHTTGDTLQVFDTAGADTIQVVTSGSTLVGIGGGTANVQNVETVTLDATAGGTDTLDYTGTTTAVSANLATNVLTGFNSVVAGSTIENVTGGSAGDTLIGSSAANVINGAAGDDQITGAGGNDTLSGGADSDTFSYTVGDGQDTVDGGATGSDVDTLNIAGTSNTETYNINPITGYLGINIESGIADVDAADGNYEIRTIEVEEIVITTNGGGDSVIVAGDLAGTGVASSTLRVTGDSGNNTFDASGMTGTPVRVVFDGAGGTDTLTGGAAGDILIGGDGSDTLKGGGGNDTIYGGTNLNAVDNSATDTVVYDHTPGGYSVTFNNDGTVTVTDINTADGDEGTDTMAGIETLNLGGTLVDFNANVLVYRGDYSGSGAGVLVGSYATIGAALAAGGTLDGDTLVVKAGDYAENLSIAKGVKLLGAQHGVDGTAHTGIASGTGETNIKGLWTIATATSVIIDGVRFFNTSPEGSGSDATLAITSAAVGTTHQVLNSVFYSNVDGGDRTTADLDPIRDDRAIYIGLGASAGSIVIEDNYVTGSMTGKYGTASWGRGIWGDLNGANVAVDGNTFEYVRTGINFDRYAGAEPAVTANTFKDAGTAIALGVNWSSISGITNSVMNNVDLEFSFQNLAGPISFDVGAAVATFIDASPEANPIEDYIHVTGSNSGDIITGSTFADAVEGRGGNDSISTGGGNDYLDGGAGADTLTGGAGDDIYVANNLDTIVEGSGVGSGTDTVFSNTSLVLSANVENLTLLEGAMRLEDFENFTPGAITDGQNGWKHAGAHDQEVVASGLGSGNAFRMSSDPANTDFGGPYSPGLADTAGEPLTTADYDGQFVRFDFKPVSSTADGSRLEVDIGTASGTDRNNFMIIENVAGGVRIAVGSPANLTGDFGPSAPFPGDWNALATGIDPSVVHQIGLQVVYKDGANNDVIRVYLDGKFIGETTTFENYRDFSPETLPHAAHSVNAEANQTNRVFFRGGANGAPQDGAGGQNAGFLFDNIAYGVGAADGTGNADNNVITGNSGNNTLTGMGGDDTLIGGAGVDTFVYSVGDGRDTVDGGTQIDTQVVNGTAAVETFNINAVSGSQLGIHIGAGAATLGNAEVVTSNVEEIVINTGNGGDTVNITGSLNGTGVSTSTITVNGGTDGDTVDASALTSAHRIVFSGGGGNDTFLSSATSANDTFDGGAGAGDAVSYAAVTANGVTVNLTTGVSTGAGTDKLVGVENVTGTAQNDTITGSAGVANSLNGGGGIDTVNYAAEAGIGAVTVNFATNTATDTSGATDTISGIENVTTGSGTSDIVVLSGAFTDWTVNFASGKWTATKGLESHDLVGVERLQFTTPSGTYHLVDPGAGGSDYASVQAAINGAASGDTILVSSGTYNETLTIDKALTILGANHGTAGTGSRGPETVLNWATGNAVTVNTIAAVTFDGLKFTGTHVTVATTPDTNITFTDSVFVLVSAGNNNNNFYLNQPTSFTFTDNKLDATGYTGALFQPVGTTGNAAHTAVTFTGNAFTGHAATYVPGDDNTVPLILNLSDVHGTVTNNTFSGVDIGVLVANGAGPLDIGDNTFEHMHRTGPNTTGGFAAGVVFFTPAPFTGTGINIHDNHFNDMDAGVRTSGVPGSTVAGSQITIDDNDFTAVTNIGFQPVGGVLHFTDTTLLPAATAVPSEFFGGSDNDTITTTAVADIMHGGAGNDTAVYAGTITAANITAALDTDPNAAGNQPGWQVNATAGGEGTDLLDDVEIVDGLGAGKFLLVGNGGYATFAAAITAASAGDTIILAAGTYTENVTINKQLTILGANHGIASNGLRGGEANIVGQIDVQVNGVTIDGIKLTDGATVGGVPAGIYVEGDNVTITNSVFVGDGTDGMAGVLTPYGGDVANLTLTNSSFTGWYWGTYFNPSTDIHATGNIFNDTGLIGDDFAETSSITGNTFNGTGGGIGYGVLDATDDLGAVAPTNIYNTGAGNGIYLYGDNQTVAGTAYDDYFTDQYKAPGVGQNDHVEGKAGHDYFDMTAGTDEMVGGAGDDVLLGGAGNDTAIYAGTITVANITAVADADPDTAGLQAGWTVNATASSEGTDGLIGVEIVDGVGAGKILLVGSSGFATIQEAIDAASNGDTILVAAGTYAGDVNVTRGVTIVGAQHGTAGASHSGAESITTGHWTLNSATKIVVDGLEFLDNRIYTNSPSDQFSAMTVLSSANHEIVNSVFLRDPNGPANVGTFVGGGTVAPHRGIEIASVGAGGQVTVSGNLFTGDNTYNYGGDNWTTAIYSNGGTGSSVISNNVFEHVRTAINADALTNTVSISGNTFKNLGTAVSVGVSTPSTVSAIQNNTFDAVDTDFNFRNIPSSNPFVFDLEGSGNALVNPATDTLYLIGGAGDDQLRGSAGNDLIEGAGGNDTVTWSLGDGNDLVMGDSGLNGLGTNGTSDALVIDNSVNATATSINLGLASANLTSLIGVANLPSTGTTDILITTGNAADGSVRADAFESLNVKLGSGGDSVTVGNLTGAAAVAISVTGGTGIDTVNSSTSDRRVTFTGGLGNDVFTTGTAGGVFIAGNADGDDTFTGGGIDDTIDYSAVTAGVAVNLATGVATGAGTDTLSGVENVVGTAQADTITVSSAMNNIDAGASNDVILIGVGLHASGDTINGGAGTNDTIRFTSTTAADTLALNVNTTGIETVVISDAAGVTTGTTALNASVAAVTGAISLTGNDGDNVLTGNGDVNTIIGGDGADTIDAGGGIDTVSAGIGNDIVIGTADGVSDSYNGGSGTDTIDYSALVAGQNISIDLGSGGATGVAIGPDTLTSFENATAGGGNDSVFGSIANNVLHGGGGTDNIVGGNGNDQLFGDAGNDTLNGGVNDFGASPAAANDVLWGGADHDTFRFESRFGDDAIGTAGSPDWEDGEDMVFVGYAAVTPIIVSVTDGVLITVNDGSVSSTVFVAGAMLSDMQVTTSISGLDLIIH